MTKKYKVSLRQVFYKDVTVRAYDEKDAYVRAKEAVHYNIGDSMHHAPIESVDVVAVGE